MPQTRDEFQGRAHEICQAFATDLEESMMAAFDKLRSEELARLDDPKGPWLLIRAIGMAVADRVIDDSLKVEAIRKLTPRVKRILNQNRD